MRTLFLTAVLWVFAYSASACDACGCSIGGNYFGILPQFNRHFVGLRWSEQTFRSAHNHSNAQNGQFNTHEHFRTMDVLARFYPLRRLQMMVLAPYHDFSRTEDNLLSRTQGIGDVSVLGNFILINTGDSLGRSTQHTLTLGGGVKIPTGQYRLRTPEGRLLHANLQPGSGSTDFMISAAYTLRSGAWGIATDVLGRINTANKKDYRFGNRVSGSAKAFYWKKVRKCSFLPNIGLFADHSAPNFDQGEQAESTGGSMVLSTFGLDVYIGKISAGFTFQQPVYQHLGEGAIQANSRWMATLNYIF
jgi:hypothetical protein